MTFTTLSSHCDAGDSIAFVGYYIPSLLVAFFAVLILGVVLFRGASTRKYILPLSIPIIFCWGIYFMSTASRNMTLALLGSESNEAAEFAYQESFKPDLHQATKLANSNVGTGIDEVGGQNVRFYAACRISDILVSSNQDFQNTILSQIRTAPIVTPGFMGTNAINCVFYIPGGAQPQLQVAEIIQHRLLELERRRPEAIITNNIP